MGNKLCAAFDLDDVLLDTESNLDWLYRALQKTLATHKIEISEENIQKIHSSNLHGFRKVCKEFDIKPKNLWKTRNKYYIDEKIRAMKRKELTSFSDVNSLRRLRKKYNLAIISDSPQEIVEFFVKEFGYNDLFDCLTGRGSKLEDLQRLKPSVHPFIRLKKNINCRIKFYIGDSGKDHTFAKNNNLKFILLSRENNSGFDNLDEIVDYLLA